MSDVTHSPTPLRIAEGPVVYLPREELGLIDVAVVLLRRWPWILLGLVSVWAVTGWWLSRSPVRYESRGVVKIGHSRVSFPIIPTKEQQNVLLEATPVAALRVYQEYAPHSPLGQKFGGAYVSNTAFEKGADELLTIFARAPSPTAAHDFLDAVLTEFVDGHRTLYAEEKQVLQARVAAIEVELQEVEAALNELTEDAAAPATDPALTALRQLNRTQRQQQKLSLAQESVRLKREMLNLQSPPTSRVSDPTLPVSPVEPRLTITWGLGTCLGLLAGCGLAFLIEFIQQLRRRLKQV